MSPSVVPTQSTPPRIFEQGKDGDIDVLIQNRREWYALDMIALRLQALKARIRPHPQGAKASRRAKSARNDIDSRRPRPDSP